MEEITPQRLYELYLDTISGCSGSVVSLDDAGIAHNVFEEFDVGARSFLHANSLATLRNAGLIDDEVARMSREVRERWLKLQMRSWTFDEIRSAEEWRQLFALCDRIGLKASGRE
jgi:hypothetical protein